MLINESNLSNIKRIAIAEFNKALEGALAMMTSSAYAERVNLGTTRADMPFIGFFPMMERTVAGSKLIYQDMEAYLYQIEPDEYRSGFKIHRDKLDDASDDPVVAAQDIGLPNIMRKAGLEAAQWMDRLAADALKNAHLSTDPVYGDDITCFDGQPFFDAAHPNGAGEPTFANEDTTGAITEPVFLFDERQKPILQVIRKAPEVSMKTDGDDAFDEDVWKIKIRARGRGGYSLPQFAFRTTRAITLANFRTDRKVMRAYVTDQGQKLAINPNRAMAGIDNIDTLEDVFMKKILSTGEENRGTSAGVQVLYNPFLD